MGELVADWRSAGIFLSGAVALCLGCLFASRFEFLRNRPQVAFLSLVAYGLTVLGLIKWFFYLPS